MAIFFTFWKPAYTDNGKKNKKSPQNIPKFGSISKTKISGFENFPDIKISHFEIFSALMTLKVSFFLVKKTTQKWISWGENRKFMDFFDKKKKTWKNHFFLASAHKQDFFEKTRKMTFSPQQIIKKGSKKLVT